MFRFYYLPKPSSPLNVIHPDHTYEIDDDIPGFLDGLTFRPYQWVAAYDGEKRIWTNPEVSADIIAELEEGPSFPDWDD